MNAYHYPTDKEIREMQQLIPDKIPFTITQIIVQIAATIFVLATALLLWRTWPQLPETVPTHFGFSGQPDAWGSKNTLLLLPIVSALLYLLLTVLLFFPKIWNLPYRYNADNVVWTMQQMRSMMIWINAACTAIFSYLTIYSALLAIAANPNPSATYAIIITGQGGLPSMTLLISIAMVFAPLIYYWRKLKKTLAPKNDR